MRRNKRHGIKREVPEASTSYARSTEEHDLAYYIHDRVELMHQVFSVLKAKDIRTMAPECVRKVSIDDLQELCTEELLGISSKRLLAVLDGAEPPSDTESSSHSASPPMETISLDSISSDEEILSQAGSKKKKHKHKRRDSKSKSKLKRKKSKEQTEEIENSRASRAGLTVLELLELQARARAIRAQLQQEQAAKPADPEPATVDSSQQSSDSEVEIKEEPTEVVEISSEDEKPNIEELNKASKISDKEPISNGKDASKIIDTGINDGPNKNTEKAQETSKKMKKDKKNKEGKDKSKKKVDKKDVTNKEPDEKDKDKNRIDSEKNLNISGCTESKIDEPFQSQNQTVTKKISDLIITVPQQSTRKIKLNRNKVIVSVPNVENATKVENRVIAIATTQLPSMVTKPSKNPPKVSSVVTKANVTAAEKARKKKQRDKKKKEIRNSVEEDHDEITLQLSDSEKMDLLEDFDRKDYEKVSSSSSEDSESSSDSDDNEQDQGKSPNESKATIEIDEDSRNATVDEKENQVSKSCDNKGKETGNVVKEIKNLPQNETTDGKSNNGNEERNTKESQFEIEKRKIDETVVKEDFGDIESNSDESNKFKGYISVDNNLDKAMIEINTVDDIPIKNYENSVIANIVNAAKNVESQDEVQQSVVSTVNQCDTAVSGLKVTEIDVTEENYVEDSTANKEISESSEKLNLELTERNIENKDINSSTRDSTNNSTLKRSESEISKSDGELSSNDSSEVEAVDSKHDVVCISDDEESKSSKKKKKKAKKLKSDFREGADQNFYRNNITKNRENTTKPVEESISIDDADDDVYEILELSDDSSCYEVDGTVLSKEPTAEEIEALSAKIDEIERKEVVTEEQIKVYEMSLENRIEEDENPENISWKDRYLGSKKVKSVLTTSNILNALRKKNKELKKKMEESKKKEAEVSNVEKIEEEPKTVEEPVLEEGSIEQYNTLQGLTKYVDPVKENIDEIAKVPENNDNTEVCDPLKTGEIEIKVTGEIEIKVTGEMKKDAKQLLKIYKRLLKYNDINRQKDPSKKKKKKQKK